MAEETSTVFGTTKIDPDYARSVTLPTAPGCDGRGSIPAEVGGYRVDRLLGRGGMGEVVLAHDQLLGRSVALKRILPELVRDAALRNRFIQEAKITAMLQHPSILPVYHFSEEGEDVFYTMRPVEGRSLAELIRSVARDPAEGCREWTVAHFIRLFLQAASAIAFAHSRGVIHGDLKPANIMIGQFEEVVILDWGVAALVGNPTDSAVGCAGEDSRMPGVASGPSRGVTGTPRYLAPELLAGEQPSVQSDIFALGVVLYEMLALQPPWEGPTVGEFLSIKAAPPSPITVQPFRNIPHRLVSVMNRALERVASKRYPSVESLAHDVAEATEARGAWVCEQRTTQPWAWSRIDGEGRTTRIGDMTVLRSTGRRNMFQFVLEGPFAGNFRVSFEMNPARGRHHLAVVLNAAGQASSSPHQGYSLAVLSGNATTLSLLRNGRDVAGSVNPQPATGNWSRVVAQRIDNRVSLFINDQEVYSYVDPIPLTGSHLALKGRSSSGVSIRNFQVACGGANATLSCLAVPDAFFNRQLYDIAQEEYLRIARSLTGTAEGRVAALRACLSAVEAARAEQDSDLRAVRLEEFQAVLQELIARDSSCLFDLASAIVACERRQPVRERILLDRALTRSPDDPQCPVVQEWILTRLHGAVHQDRPTVAQLAPLAIQFCMEASGGRRLILDLIRRVRRDWEMPSLLESRLHERIEDLTLRAEALLFFGFWSSQPLLIYGAIRDLAGHGLLEPRHVVDGLFALMELDALDLTTQVLDSAEERLAPELKLAPSFMAACRSSTCTLQGRLELAEKMFATLVPDASDRLYNGTRLRLAQAQFALGSTDAAFRTLRQVSPCDLFAREHRAWFYMLLDDADGALRELSPLIEQGNHKRPRDMCNFLYAAALLRQGKGYQAREVAGMLPDTENPRTWTLGSYHLSGRLGGGDVNKYLCRALPWERRQLGRQLALLARAQEDAEGLAFWSNLATEPLVRHDSEEAGQILYSESGKGSLRKR